MNDVWNNGVTTGDKPFYVDDTMTTDIVRKISGSINTSELDTYSGSSESGYDEIKVFLKTDVLDGTEFDITKFAKGVKDISYMCGQISALVNIGISPENALTYLMNKESEEMQTKHALEISKLNADINLKSMQLGNVTAM